jgi:hypothetical protein
MPLYKFGLEERCPLDASEWHRDDVAALEAAAQVTVDLVRNRNTEEPAPMVLTFRMNARA